MYESKMFEEVSMLKENTAPVRPGEISGTYWFYERSKSRWNQATFYMKKAQRTAWISLDKVMEFAITAIPLLYVKKLSG